MMINSTVNLSGKIIRGKKLICEGDVIERIMTALLAEKYCIPSILLLFYVTFQFGALAEGQVPGNFDRLSGNYEPEFHLKLSGNSSRLYEINEDSLESIISIFTLDRQVGNGDFHAGISWHSNATDTYHYLFTRPEQVAFAKEHIELIKSPVDIHIGNTINLTAVLFGGQLIAEVNGKPILTVQNISNEDVDRIGFRTHNAEASLGFMTASQDERSFYVTGDCILPIPFCRFLPSM